MSEEIKDLQKQIRGIMPQNTLNGEQIATDIAEWMVGEGYKKLEVLDEEAVQWALYYEYMKLDEEYQRGNHPNKFNRLAQAIIAKFGKPEIKVPKINDESTFSELEEESPELNKMIGWNECVKEFKRLNGLD